MFTTYVLSIKIYIFITPHVNSIEKTDPTVSLKVSSIFCICNSQIDIKIDLPTNIAYRNPLLASYKRSNFNFSLRSVHILSNSLLHLLNRLHSIPLKDVTLILHSHVDILFFINNI